MKTVTQIVPVDLTSTTSVEAFQPLSDSEKQTVINATVALYAALNKVAPHILSKDITEKYFDHSDRQLKLVHALDMLNDIESGYDRFIDQYKAAGITLADFRENLSVLASEIRSIHCFVKQLVYPELDIQGKDRIARGFKLNAIQSIGSKSELIAIEIQKTTDSLNAILAHRAAEKTDKPITPLKLNELISEAAQKRVEATVAAQEKNKALGETREQAADTKTSTLSKIPADKVKKAGTSDVSKTNPKVGGTINAQTKAFFERVSTYSVSVACGPAGELVDLYSWLKAIEKNDARVKSVMNDLYTEKTVPLVSELSELVSGEVEYELPKEAINGNSFPVPYGFQVLACTALDKVGEPIGDVIRIRECALGGAEIISSISAEYNSIKVRLRQVAPKEFTSETLATLLDSIPSTPIYKSENALKEMENLKEHCDSSSLRSQIWRKNQLDRGMYYVATSRLVNVLNSAGPVTGEVIDGLGMGTCESLSYYGARDLRELDVVALVIGGHVASSTNKSFTYNPGHAQILALTDEGIKIYDSTIKATSTLKLNTGGITESEWQALEQVVKHGTKGEVSEECYKFREFLNRPCKYQTVNNNFLDNENVRVWRDNSTKIKEDNISQTAIRQQRILKEIQKKSRFEELLLEAFTTSSMSEICKFITSAENRIGLISQQDYDAFPTEKRHILDELKEYDVVEKLIKLVAELNRTGRYDTKAKEEFSEAMLEYFWTEDEGPLYFTSDVTLRKCAVPDNLKAQTFKHIPALLNYLDSHAQVDFLCGNLEYLFNATKFKNMTDASHKRYNLSSEVSRYLETVVAQIEELEVKGVSYSNDTIIFSDLSKLSLGIAILHARMKREKIPINNQYFKEIGIKLIEFELKRLPKGTNPELFNIFSSADDAVFNDYYTYLTDTGIIESLNLKKLCQKHISMLLFSDDCNLLVKDCVRIIKRANLLGVFDDAETREAVQLAALLKLQEIYTDITFNFPSTAVNRLSALIATSANADLFDYYSGVQLLTELGVIDREVIKSKWPNIDADKVIAGLLSNIEIDGREVVSIKRGNSYFTINLAGVPQLAKLLFTHNRVALDALEFVSVDCASAELDDTSRILAQLSSDSPWIANDISEKVEHVLGELHELKLSNLRNAESINLANEVLKPLSKAKIYQAMLWLEAAIRAGSKTQDFSDDDNIYSKYTNLLDGANNDPIRNILSSILLNRIEKQFEYEDLIPRRSKEINSIFNTYATELSFKAKQFSSASRQESVTKQQALGMEEFSKFMEAYRLAAGNPDRAKVALESVFPHADRLFKAFPALTPDDVARCIFAHQLLRDISKDCWPYHGKSKMISKISVMTGTDGDIEAAIKTTWDTHSPFAITVMDPLKACARKGVELAERISIHPKRGSTSNFFAMIKDRSVCLGPKGESGEFSGLRTYQHGDNFKSIDWRATARTDKLIVRESRPEVNQPVAIIVDLDWIAEGYQNFIAEEANDKSRAKFRELEELIAMCVLAQREGEKPQLIITRRGQVLKSFSNREMVSGIVRGDEILYFGLAEILQKHVVSHANLVWNEGQVLADNEALVFDPVPREELNIPKSALIVAAVSKNSRSRAAKSLSRLKGQGRSIRVLS